MFSPTLPITSTTLSWSEFSVLLIGNLASSCWSNISRKWVISSLFELIFWFCNMTSFRKFNEELAAELTSWRNRSFFATKSVSHDTYIKGKKNQISRLQFHLDVFPVAKVMLSYIMRVKVWKNTFVKLHIDLKFIARYISRINLKSIYNLFSQKQFFNYNFHDSLQYNCLSYITETWTATLWSITM